MVVDPRRDIAHYVDDCGAGLTIELVLETHFHADFLSGHLELASATGAEIAYSAGAETEFPCRKLADGERIALGDVALEIRHTPGHTPESISIVVWEHADDDVPYGVLTGDTLFIGDVGRPDLLVVDRLHADELAEQLYDSLHQQLLTLPDATRVYPAHGAGSACGKNLSTDTSSTIGEQRADNYALLAERRRPSSSWSPRASRRARLLRLRRRPQSRKTVRCSTKPRARRHSPSTSSTAPSTAGAMSSMAATPTSSATGT